MMLLLGEQAVKKEQIAKAEKAYAEVSSLRERINEIDRLLEACETVIKSDHPDWKPDNITPARPFAHKIPVELGNATRLALDILRTAKEPMTGRQMAREVLRRSGQDDPHRDTLTRVANAIGNSLRKRHQLGFVANDGEWPARWWAVKP